jgi:hypothetical protein
MKTLYVLLSCLIVFTASAQDKPKGNISVKAIPYSKNQELTNLMRGLNVHYNTVTFKSEDLKGKIFTVVSKEFKKGKLVKTDTLVRKSLFDFLPPIAADSIVFSVMSRNTEKDKMRITFMFERFEISHDYKVLKTDDYSLRAYCERIPVNTGERFYAFAYILPYEDKEGNMYYCAVESSSKDIEKWGQEFGIKHYILFEMEFSDNI